MCKLFDALTCDEHTCEAFCDTIGSPDSLPHEHLTGCPLISEL